MGCTGSRLQKASEQRDYVEHVLESRWTLGKELGRGAFGRVVLGTNKTIAGKFAAIKIMSKQAMTEEDIAAACREIEIMRKLQHPNIVKFYDFFDEGGNLYVVLEYLKGGELFARVQKRDHYSEKDARDLVFILLSALKHMHDLGIVHRDLKPENLLMAGESDADVKIADFGFATYAQDDTLTETCGSPAYVAPEVLTGGPYGKSADMWSLGVITYILLGGYAPFDGGGADPDNVSGRPPPFVFDRHALSYLYPTSHLAPSPPSPRFVYVYVYVYIPLASCPEKALPQDQGGSLLVRRGLLGRRVDGGPGPYPASAHPRREAAPHGGRRAGARMGAQGHLGSRGAQVAEAAADLQGLQRPPEAQGRRTGCDSNQPREEVFCIVHCQDRRWPPRRA